MAQLVKQPEDEWTVESVDDGEWVVEPVNGDPHPQNPPQTMNDERSAGRVAIDQAKNVLSGIPQAITGIPDALAGGVGAIGQMLTGGGTSQAQDMLKGITQPFSTVARGVGALVAPDSVQAPSNQEWEQAAQGAGAQLGGELLGAGAMKLAKAKSLRAAQETKGRTLRSRIAPRGERPPPMAPTKASRAMEMKMAPSGKEAQLGAERIAPELAENPVLAQAKAYRFNQKLHEEYKIAGANVHAAEQSVPRTTKIPQQTVTDGLETVIEKYREMGATEAATAVAREWEKWAAKDANIPWEDYITVKRRLGDQMKVMGQFRETGTAAEKATGAAMKEAYRVVADAGNVSPELEAANHQYWLMHSAMEDAGLSFSSGRKISEIGKPPKAGIVRRTARRVAPYVVGGGLGGAAYRGMFND